MSNRFKHRGLWWLGTALVIVAVVLLNLCIGALEDRFGWTIDATQARVTGLSDETKQILAELAEPVTLTAVFQRGTTGADRAKIEQVLARYQAKSARITVDAADPVVEPARILAVTSDTLSEGAVLVTTGDGTRSRVLRVDDYLYEAQSPYTGEAYTVFDLEGQLTGAIRYVTSKNRARVLFLTGHGEMNAQTQASAFWRQLEIQNDDPQTIDLSDEGAALRPTDTLVILDPQRDLPDAQYERLSAWLSSGGHLLVCLSQTADTANLPNLARLLDAYALGVGSGIVRESEWATDRWMDNVYYLVPELADHPATQSVRDANGFLVLPQTRPLRRVEMPMPGAEYTTLLQTSAQATIEDGGEASAPGAVPLALAMEQADTRVVLLSSLFLLADTDFIYYTYNLEFVLGCLSWLSGAEETVAVAPRLVESDALRIPDSATIWRIAAVVIVGMPLAVLVVGVIVCARRRRL